MIFLFTDFGAQGPYLGQIKAVLHGMAPGVQVIDLVSNAPSADPESSACLLGALSQYLPPECVVLGVVDPGVGGIRDPIVVRADGRWLVGPDNGLFDGVSARAEELIRYVIQWRPARLSASFHGRDLFAPVAARVAVGDLTGLVHDIECPRRAVATLDIDRVIYFDIYGNAFTGRRYSVALKRRRLVVNGHMLSFARTFCDVASGCAFWYRNSIDLVEIAVNCGSAKTNLGLKPGTPIEWTD